VIIGNFFRLPSLTFSFVRPALGSHSYYFRLEALSPNFQLEMEVVLLRGKFGSQWWVGGTKSMPTVFS
jgi:hypothetical protein